MKIRLAKDSQLPENCLLNETELNSLKLERNASMGDYCSLAGSLHLLDRAQVGPFCTINGTLKIGSDAAMEAHCLVRGSVFVGPRATIGSRCRLLGAISIDRDVVIGDEVAIYAESAIPLDGGFEVIIEPNAEIRAGATLLPGSHIGAHSII